MPVRFVASCRAVLAAVLLLACAAPATSAEWYVGPAGSDENTGTDAEHPVATLAHALTLTGEGDTIRVLGSLTGEGNTNIRLYRAGLTLEGYGAGVDPENSETWPVLTAEGNHAVLWISWPDVTVRYLAFVGGTNVEVSLYCDPPLRNVTIDHCKFGPGIPYNQTGALYMNNTYGCTITGCQFMDYVKAVEVNNSDQDTFTNITFNRCPSTIDASSCTNITISDIVNNSSAGFSLFDCDYIDIKSVKYIADGTGTDVIYASYCDYLNIVSCDIGNTSYGIRLSNVNKSIIADNYFHDTSEGLEISTVKDSMIVGNIFLDNACGVYFQSGTAAASGCFVFLNEIRNNLYNNISGSEQNTIITSPCKLHLDSGGHPVKASLGNYYGSWWSPDANGDGIFDIPLTTVYGGNVIDPTSLVKDFFSDPEAASLLWFGGWADGTGRLDLREISDETGTKELAVQASVLLVASSSEGSDRMYRGGAPAAQTGFTGWLYTNSALPAGGKLTFVLGHAADGLGRDFQPAGPTGEVTGDGESAMQLFALSGKNLKVPAGRHLALRITNASSQTVALRLGSAWLGLSASLPPVSLAPAYLGLLDDPVITY